MSVIEDHNAEILRPQLKLIAHGRSRELEVPPEVGNRDRVSIKTVRSTGRTARTGPVRRGRAVSKVRLRITFSNLRFPYL